METLTIIYIAVLVIMGLFSFGAIKHDKQAAQSNEWRTTECRLHALEFFGGFIGSFLAQVLYWHKVKKTSYQLVFWVIVSCHCVAIYYVQLVWFMNDVGVVPSNNTNSVPA